LGLNGDFVAGNRLKGGNMPAQGNALGSPNKEERQP
jgi:hypothetical protein